MPDTRRPPAPAPSASAPRRRIEAGARAPEGPLLAALVAEAALDADARAAVAEAAAGLVRAIRAGGRPGFVEQVLVQFGLSTDEGVALMCLAEALLRVPDAATMDALIEDKIAPGDWSRHLGRAASPLVNASTWALMLTGRVLDEGEGDGLGGRLRAAIRRLGEPVIRRAVAAAIREMGRQFVLGETIGAAMARARAEEARGIAMSYDMLGEAARTEADAARYLAAYCGAVEAAGTRAGLAAAPGVSVKLSALHPRYEPLQTARVMAELPPRLLSLAARAAALGVPLTIDAEEAERLVLSLEVIEAVFADPSLAGWDGFGVAVQAYGRRAGAVIDWLADLAARHDRRLTIRLVKGAYWDSEIKRAQVAGLDSFPVFTRKAATDVSFIALARRLFGHAGRIRPQFATHNAHSMAAVLHLARVAQVPPSAWEFQRLHGMGERLHALVMDRHGTRHSVYAPVGAHRDLLAYLVRRLLENGANSSFVNRIVDAAVPAEAVAACPFAVLAAAGAPENPGVTPGSALFAPRRNARGWDLGDPADLAALEAARAPFRAAPFTAAPLLAAADPDPDPPRPVTDPATGEAVGEVAEASAADLAAALAAAAPWDAPPAARAAALRRAADAYEADHGALLTLLAREAGKTMPDAIAELREAVDFLRYYAEAATGAGRGVVACISPWNFPLAIFTGQIAAALAAGCGVLAKPAEETPLVAHRASLHLRTAGVPAHALQLLPGRGETVGAALTRDPRIRGVAFTGGTDTARTIRAAMAAQLDPGAPLVAETGGINAMVVDSSALPEQAVRDILASAFQSAGQRCSALRMLYVQEEIAAPLLELLVGAMATLRLGDPWAGETDVGPVIDAAAQARLAAHVAAARAEGRLIAAAPAPPQGSFVGPAILRVAGIGDLGGEVFGPILHVAPCRAEALGAVIEAINATGYGLTFAIHSRIDARVEAAAARVRAGNIYVNRNQIGAVVGSQPFGGEGLSGTGPKAGGPMTLLPWAAPEPPPPAGFWDSDDDPARLAAALAAAALPEAPLHEAALHEAALPGPTGESNRLRLYPRLPALCLGPGAAAAAAQAAAVRRHGGAAVAATGRLDPAALGTLQGFGCVLWWGEAATARALVLALAARPGPILPLVTAMPGPHHLLAERHVCIDTTAAGGNAALLASAGG
jgi:RHH-type proline utilization regulon transcriptional repressor/proline dehydrogenase/delta 1-pyrroline-5-carboxylate dehydrogenase